MLHSKVVCVGKKDGNKEKRKERKQNMSYDKMMSFIGKVVMHVNVVYFFLHKSARNPLNRPGTVLSTSQKKKLCIDPKCSEFSCKLLNFKINTNQ